MSDTAAGLEIMHSLSLSAFFLIAWLFEFCFLHATRAVVPGAMAADAQFRGNTETADRSSSRWQLDDGNIVDVFMC